MKKKFFDKSLIAEGLLQLKLSGLIFLIISVVGSALPAIFTWISYHNVCIQSGPASQNAWNTKIVYITNVAGILLPIIYIAPFVFCLVLFSFLNKRKGSDFYHSLSSTRISLFVNLTISILIWLAIIIVSSVFVASAIYMMSGMIMNPLFIPYLILTFFTGAMLVTACMLFAMSITGTVLTNIIMSGMILFLPRLIMVLSYQSIVYTYPIVSQDSPSFFNLQYNIPVSFIFAYLFQRMNIKVELFTSIMPIVYTFILAVIYLAIACLLFRIRKSESAGSSASNRILQHIIRCVVSLSVAMMIPIYMVYNQAPNRTPLQYYLSTYITIAIIAIFIYFLYELITTKSVKKMFKSAPVLLVVVAVCGILGLSLNSVKNSILNFTPSGSDISSVTLQTYDPNNETKTTYSSLVQKNVQFRDKDTLDKVSDILTENINTINSGNYPEGNGTTTHYKAGITLKNGQYVERILYANSTQTSGLLNSMRANSDYPDTYTQLSNEEKNINVTNLTNQSSNNKLWKMYKSECANLSQSDKELICRYSDRYNGYYKETDLVLGSITVYGNIGVYNYGQEYPITMKTPKTAAMYVEMINAENKSIVKNFLRKSIVKGPKTSIQVNLYNNSELLKNPSLELASLGFDGDKFNAENIQKCFDVLLRQADEPVDINRSYAGIYYFTNNRTYVYFQPLSTDNAKAIQDLKFE